jgi:hypothetical protein
MRKSRRSRLPHQRVLLPDNDPSLIYYESRGLREFSIPAGAAGKPHEPHLTKARELNQFAHRILQRSGERSLKDALAALDNKKKNDAESESKMISRSLLKWYSEIAARHGSLSPVAIAAAFLGVQHVTIDLLIDNADATTPEEVARKVKQVYALCDAWHWFHLEVSQEHRRAFSGAKSIEGAQRGGRKKHPGRDQRMAQEFLKRCPTSNLSKSALKAEIGRSYKLRRRAAIDAINRGLEKIVR